MNQLAGGFRVPRRFRRPDEMIELLERFALLIDQQLE